MTYKKGKKPGFGNEERSIPQEKLDSILASETSNSLTENFSKSFMRKGIKKALNMQIQWSGFQL